MKVLILGVNGMIGHKLFHTMLKSDLEVYGTIRKFRADYGNIALMQSPDIIEGFEADNFSIVKKLICEMHPDVVINCIGITKRKPEINDPLLAININALFPHRLAALCKAEQIRMIHFSTDCVFSGDSGSYDENSNPNADDLYGKTKGLGEVNNMPNCITIRSSFIGRELSGKTELLEWFIAQDGKKVKGFTNAMYSGVSTSFMSRIILEIIQNHPLLNGLYQLAPQQPVSKYDLLCMAKQAFNLDIEIIKDDGFVSDKSLNGDKLKNALGIVVPSWLEMLAELALEDIY